MTKRFYLPASAIRDVAPGFGGCVASDRIVVDGCRVGYMYREPPVNNLDSGWRFLAGDETDEYMEDADRHGIYDVNTVANHDLDIIEYLEAPVGASFARNEDGDLVDLR